MCLKVLESDSIVFVYRIHTVCKKNSTHDSYLYSIYDDFMTDEFIGHL